MSSSTEQNPLADEDSSGIAKRFRGFLPVVVDVETGGFVAATDALLEIAAVIIRLDDDGRVHPGETIRYHVKPFAGARLDPASLEVTGIDRAILVGHNAFFDLQFLNAVVERTNIKRNPFHPFSSFDTVTLGGLAVGQTVLGRAVVAAGFEWDESQAHSAAYDAEMTALLFCEIVNRFKPIYEVATR